MVIPKIHNLKSRVSEPWVLDLLQVLLEETEGAFLDVGVNLGQILVKTKVAEPQRRYVGFEPNAACVYYLQELIRVNGFKNCEIIPVALSDADGLGSLEFFGDDPSGPAASVVSDFRNGAQSRCWVPTLCYESVAKAIDLDAIGVVTIDVEGGELEVLQTLEPQIVEHRPLVLLEILPTYSPERKERLRRQLEVEQLFRRTGYLLLRIHRANGRLSLEQIDDIGIHSNMDWCAYVACPSALGDRLKSRFNPS